MSSTDSESEQEEVSSSSTPQLKKKAQNEKNVEHKHKMVGKVIELHTSYESKIVVKEKGKVRKHSDSLKIKWWPKLVEMDSDSDTESETEHKSKRQ